MTKLAALINYYCPKDGVHRTAIPGVSLVRSSEVGEPVYMLHQPALCIVAQGKKRLFLGGEVYTYDSSQHLIISVDLPVSGEIIEARPETPYLCIQIDLDTALLAELLLAEDAKTVNQQSSSPALTLSPTTPEILGAAGRLLELLATPPMIGTLAPLIEREILYRLLLSERAPHLRQITLADSKINSINRAIGWLKENYREPFSADILAREARMSVSAFHRHFKVVTSLSPLQYQKQLRLQEARRLILGTSLDAAAVGFEVGYESPSQFSREYRRLFGAPPGRDTVRLKTLTTQ